MKLYLKKGSVLKINSDTRLELLNVDDFISTMKRESSFVPARHIKVVLKYKLIYNTIEYNGESIFDSYKGIENKINNGAPYEVELINWKLSDKEEKYLEFNIKEK